MSIQLNVEVQEVQLVLNALSKLPFENVADAFFKIRGQAEQQLAAQQQAAAAPQAPESEAGNKPAEA